jgi:UDP-2,3-diacylglucosamine pyrophosphatase LpxH
MGREKMSFSQKIKAKFKDAVKFINQFEQTAADLAVEKAYTYVICGHIHHAEIQGDPIYRTNRLGTIPKQRRLGRKPYLAGVPQ